MEGVQQGPVLVGTFFRTKHFLVFAMEVDCLLMLQLYLAIVELLSRLF